MVEFLLKKALHKEKPRCAQRRLQQPKGFGDKANQPSSLMGGAEGLPKGDLKKPNANLLVE
jgi:hypothetical protein